MDGVRAWDLAVGQNQWDPILWFRCTNHFRTYCSGDWDVYWGYDLDVDPWPFVSWLGWKPFLGSMSDFSGERRPF